MAFGLDGNFIFRASPEEIWCAMNNPGVLVACLPAVSFIERKTGDHFEIHFEKKFSFIPVKAVVHVFVCKEGEEAKVPEAWTVEASSRHKLIGQVKAGTNVRTEVMSPGCRDEIRETGLSVTQAVIQDRQSDQDRVERTRLHYEAYANFGETLLRLLGRAYEKRVAEWIEEFFQKFQSEIDNLRQK